MLESTNLKILNSLTMTTKLYESMSVDINKIAILIDAGAIENVFQPNNSKK